jgi:hypothetical protein
VALLGVGCAKEIVPIPDVPARPAPTARPAPVPPGPVPPARAPAALPPDAPAAPVTQAPTFRVGEEWRWVGGGVTRIVAVEGGLHVTEDREGRRRAYDPTWTLVKVTDRRGAAIPDPQVGRRVLDFPLTVGKQWTWRGTFPAARGSAPRPYVDQYRVARYEAVQVPAGTFGTFVIEHVQEVPAQGGAPAAEARRTLWYSPEARVFVKVESPTPGWGGGALESYSPRP